MKKGDLSFEESMNKLEDIVKKLETGNVSLNDSIKLYEDGIKLSGECIKTLNEAKQKIEVIKNENYEKIDLNIKNNRES